MDNDITQSKIGKVVFNQISLILALTGTILSAFTFLTNLQHKTDIQLVKLEAKIEATESINAKLQNIKDNDLHELQIKMDVLLKEQIEIQKSITILQTLILNNKKP